MYFVPFYDNNIFGFTQTFSKYNFTQNESFQFGFGIHSLCLVVLLQLLSLDNDFVLFSIFMYALHMNISLSDEHHRHFKSSYK